MVVIGFALPVPAVEGVTSVVTVTAKGIDKMPDTRFPFPGHCAVGMVSPTVAIL